jgi:hypothetical protein
MLCGYFPQPERRDHIVNVGLYILGPVKLTLHLGQLESRLVVDQLRSLVRLPAA